MKAPILVTGAAGFIGMHVAYRLLTAGRSVLGIDNLNAYYDPNLKHARLRQLHKFQEFQFNRMDIADRNAISDLFSAHSFTSVVHLAAQAGVRYSLVDPHAYVDSNLTGFLNILEGCRNHGCCHLLYASSSSVYGANSKIPFRASETADHPVSLYGATKRANELMAHSYAHLFGLPATGLRFFTVYGPWGRPDMAYWLFTDAILSGQPIRLFNNGRMRRDFTYVDDIADAIVRLIDEPPSADSSWSSDNPNPASSAGPWRIYNIGSSEPAELSELVRLIEGELGIKAVCELWPMQSGDVVETYADVQPLQQALDFRPRTSLAEGVCNFVTWYKQYRHS